MASSSRPRCWHPFQAFGRHPHPRLLSLGLGVLLLSMPMGGLPMAELQALNRELGRLCMDPPREALTVCRLHARLVRAL
jgi:hypothetical protein